MGTSLEEDKKMMQDKTIKPRKFYAILYRIEVKNIIFQQIHAAQIAQEILKKLQSLSPFGVSCSRVFDLETKEGKLVIGLF